MSELRSHNLQAARLITSRGARTGSPYRHDRVSHRLGSHALYLPQGRNAPSRLLRSRDEEILNIIEGELSGRVATKLWHSGITPLIHTAITRIPPCELALTWPYI